MEAPDERIVYRLQRIRRQDAGGHCDCFGGAAGRGPKATGAHHAGSQPERDLRRNQVVFSIEARRGQRVVLIEDKETHDVLQQIPPEYVLELAQNFGPSSETKR
jgi:hypothetical protein